jgi:hypothetical protein
MSRHTRFSIAVTVFCCSLLGASQVRAATYYVDASGSNGNLGTSPDKPWATVTYAATKATAGDTVYIKAGLYIDEEVVITNTGVENAPIVFQGYTNQPGDTPDPHYAPGEALDSTALPVLKAQSDTLQASGRGIYANNKHYIEIRNLGVTLYNSGMYINGSISNECHHVVVENVFVVSIGAIKRDDDGILFEGCANVTLRKSVVTDAAMENIRLQRCRDSLVEECKSYAVVCDLVDPNGPSTDYHIVLGDSQNCVIERCVAENRHHKEGCHDGHGIGIKDHVVGNAYPNRHSEGNRIADCVADNMGEDFYVAHEAHHNEFVNCSGVGQDRTDGVMIRDGAHNNTFRNMRIIGALAGLAFQDTEEGFESDGKKVPQITTDNTVANSVFANTKKGIELWNADNNSIKNCVFDNVGSWALIRSPTYKFFPARKDTGNVCRNSIVTNSPGLFNSNDADTDCEIAFTYTDFWANNFDMPASEDNLNVDPLFADKTHGDYHLLSAHGRWDTASSSWVKDSKTSPCIDTGNPADDFSAEPCPNGARINMGAYGNTAQASMGSTSPQCDSTGGSGGTTGSGGTSGGGGTTAVGGMAGSGGSSGASGAETPAVDDSGCGCRSGSTRGGSFAAILVAAGAAGILRRRRSHGLGCLRGTPAHPLR